MERIPPHATEAEQSVLAAMLLDNEVIPSIQEILRGEDFYHESHRIIYRTIGVISDRNQPADLITLTEELKARGDLEAAGGLQSLVHLADLLPSTAKVEHYARIVHQKSTLRRILASVGEIADLVFSAGDDSSETIDRVEQIVLDVTKGMYPRGVRELQAVMVEVYERLAYLHQADKRITGVPTGFQDLDHLTTGFQPSELIIIAARPGMGKTTLGLNAAYSAAKSGVPVLFFSVEMAAEQLGERVLAAEAEVDSHRLRTGEVYEPEWRRISKSMARLATVPLYIDDTPAITISELRSRSRRLKAERDIQLIVVDYLQLVQATGRSENRNQEVAEIARALKALARELKVPVIALSQLSRGVEHRQDKRPTLADLRESGELENTADLVLFIYRDGYYNPESETPHVTEIILGKHRSGPVGTVNLVFREKFCQFVPMEWKHDEAVDEAV
ncbi:MAG: replicative DNA helicase [Firmicutes bacterium]|nr:replicative DNA helicase [Bacillota bacterium]